MPKLKLTKSAIEQLPFPASGRVIYTDSETRGLALRVGSNSKVFYVLRWDAVRNKPVWTKLGDAVDITPQIARAKAEAELTRRRTEPAPGPTVTVRTGAELVKRYMQEHAPTKGTGEWDGKVLARFFLPTFGSRDVKSITRAELVDALIASSDSKRQTDKYRAVYSVMFNLAIAWGWVDTSPIHGTKKRGKPVKRKRFLSMREAAQLWIALESMPNQTMADIYRLLLLTMCRRTEVTMMEWNEMDLPKKLWVIPESKTKNGRPFAVPLSAPAVEIVERIKSRGQHQYLHHMAKPKRVCGDGVPDPNWVTKLLRQFREENPNIFGNWEHFHVHDLRRTGATGISTIMSRKDIAPILLNHTDHSVTGHYDWSEYLDLKREALSLWAERLMGEVSVVRASAW